MNTYRHVLEFILLIRFDLMWAGIMLQAHTFTCSSSSHMIISGGLIRVSFLCMSLIAECSFHGSIYNNGDVFSPDDCNRCTCKVGNLKDLVFDLHSCASHALASLVPFWHCFWCVCVSSIARKSWMWCESMPITVLRGTVCS